MSNNRTFSTPKGQAVKNDIATTQAAKTETNVKYVGLQKPSDVDIELETKLQEIEMKTEELMNIYNGGVNVNVNSQTSIVNEYGIDRETDTYENEAVSNVKVYNKNVLRLNQIESAKDNAPLVSKEMIKMRPTLPYYYCYNTSCEETGGGTGTISLHFNTYAYPAKLTTSRAKFVQAMIAGVGRIDVSNVYDLHNIAFPFPNMFGSAVSGEIDPEDPSSYESIIAFSTGIVSISDIYLDQSHGTLGRNVILYDDFGNQVAVDLGSHFDQISYNPGGWFAFPQSTHIKASTITGYVEFTFIIQGHVPEGAFNSYDWGTLCTLEDDRVNPMGVWT